MAGFTIKELRGIISLMRSDNDNLITAYEIAKGGGIDILEHFARKYYKAKVMHGEKSECILAGLLPNTERIILAMTKAREHFRVLGRSMTGRLAGFFISTFGYINDILQVIQPHRDMINADSGCPIYSKKDAIQFGIFRQTLWAVLSKHDPNIFGGDISKAEFDNCIDAYVARIEDAERVNKSREYLREKASVLRNYVCQQFYIGLKTLFAKID